MRKPGVKLIEICSGSPADLAGLHPGDRLLTLEGRTIEDVLDLHFYLDGGKAALTARRGDSLLHVDLDLSSATDPGWEVEPLQVRSCHCDCTFCFVQQLPAGLRSSLYVMDEDYRFSFLFGSYLTLVGFTSLDLERVLRLRLSPLYVSIHATDPLVRGRLLGLKSAPILPLLEKLIAGGIQIHGQIVLVPGYNNGESLKQTLDELQPLYPGLASLSVVPVGLTGFRMNLASLRLMNPEEAHSSLNVIRSIQNQMLESQGHRWVFPADELLQLGGVPFLADDEYEDYPQLDNGVGLARWTMTQAGSALENLPKSLSEPRRLLWVTGHSAGKVLSEIAAAFTSRIANLNIDLLPVKNNLLGENVTVAGLLGGRDISGAIQDFLREKPDSSLTKIYLPPFCLNADNLFLDDWTEERIALQVGLPVEAFDGNWDAMILGEDPEACK